MSLTTAETRHLRKIVRALRADGHTVGVAYETDDGLIYEAPLGSGERTILAALPCTGYDLLVTDDPDLWAVVISQKSECPEEVISDCSQTFYTWLEAKGLN